MHEVNNLFKYLKQSNHFSVRMYNMNKMNQWFQCNQFNKVTWNYDQRWFRSARTWIWLL